MSKARHKRQTRKRKAKSRSKRANQRPAQFKWRHKLFMMGVPTGILLLLLGLLYLMALQGYRRSIERRVERLRMKHDLNESQAREIFEIEVKYHRNESPFSMRKKPTPQQRKEHHRQIDALLGAEGTAHGH